MFKKLSYIIIALVLLITTTGFSVSKHYCKTNLVSISINHEEKPCCDMGSGCCQNEIAFYHLDDNFVFHLVLENNSVISIDLLFPLFYITCENIYSIDLNSAYQISESPPLLYQQNIHSFLQTYLC